MKTRPIDFFLSGLILTVIFGVSLFSVAKLFAPLTQGLAPYNVLADFFLFLLAYGFFSGLTARLMLRIKPFQPGCYSMDDPIFTYWKLFTVVCEFGRGTWLPFSVVFAKPLIAMWFGAKVGKDIALGGRLVDPQLISIGNEAIIGQDSVITAHTITSGKLILGEVKIGDGATVGVNAVIMSGVELGEGSTIAAGSVVTLNTKIPEYELWGGIPAKKLKNIDRQM
ncbi:acyltransferase [Methylocaldum sp.]|uniref:acyltransferase n=1 Tax=Methylocaldum sp. TaxID=1969727 RepID=UPI002D491A71|nr:DapH/DapD/GlmU-related protein [Methylocaldum sp.]HYE34697.1 DapH/DapD/GlmU-related protein [Methylocaldum sp.]